MNSNPLFSILIANYNNGRFIEEAIESVMTQTYLNWEIIIVDDGSTDNSNEIYKQYEKDTRIIICYNDVNYGCGYTKRRCAELANGELCGFLDPDDVLLSDAIETMINVHAENPDVSIVFSRQYLCDQNLNIFGESRLLEIPEGETYLTHNDHEAEHFSSFTKKHYLMTAGLSPIYKAGVDADLNFRMEEVGDIYILNKITYKYRVGLITSITADSNKGLYWNIIVRYDASVRRGISPDPISYKLFTDQLKIKTNEASYLTELKIRNSKAYKIGKLVLKPFSLLKQYLLNE